MTKINTTVLDVEENSIAYNAGIRPGDKILKINGHEFHDILEYRFLSAEYEITIEVLKTDGSTEILTVECDYEELGIAFEESLVCEAQSCNNKCIFCFIDQLPKGMRETVYFKDDDARLSFLQGNYVTLTNMTDEEIDRLINMRVSPINISVHTTNPELREKMLKNRFAGKCYSLMKKLAEGRIYMNCQIVLCPGVNDGEELLRTLGDFAALYPFVQSVSVVPVGLTAHRDGLYPLIPFNRESSLAVIKQVSVLQDNFLKELGSRMVYLSDEFYINAGLPIPDSETYEGFPQLENGVGLIASMREEFEHGITLLRPKARNRSVSIATGELAAPFIRELSSRISATAPGVSVRVFAIKNNFFGGGVNVSGLVCGTDIIDQLKDKNTDSILLIPHSMLRDDDNLFLDDTTTEDVEKALNTTVIPVYNDGYEFIEAVLGEELEF